MESSLGRWFDSGSKEELLFWGSQLSTVPLCAPATVLCSDSDLKSLTRPWMNIAYSSEYLSFVSTPGESVQWVLLAISRGSELLYGTRGFLFGF